MSSDPIVLVHLSDVHFQKRSLASTYDLDVDVRNELELDLQTQARKHGTITGIMVTGDISFAGDPKEFDAAAAWLAKVSRLVNSRPEAVWTVPGNHDVDRRNVIEKSEVVRLLQESLRKQPSRLEKLQRDAAAMTAFFTPLAAYNDFAAPYHCDIGPDRLAWAHDLPLNDGSILRLYGLNSTLTSSKTDDDGVRLVLGDMSHLMLREPGVSLVSLCHHPPDWLLDHDQVTNLLNARTRLQLFGHKHAPRIERLNDSLRVTAGAVHPDRGEKKWEPRYNFISCEVRGRDLTRVLEVTIHPRVWSEASRGFVADTTDPIANRPIGLPLEPWSAPLTPASSAIHSTIAMHSTTAGGTLGTADAPRRSSMDAARRLTYRFLTLPYHERIEIANTLRLLEDEDKGLPERILVELFFRRAGERRQLGELWSEVEKRHGDDVTDPNPYIGR